MVQYYKLLGQVLILINHQALQLVQQHVVNLMLFHQLKFHAEWLDKLLLQQQ